MLLKKLPVIFNFAYFREIKLHSKFFYLFIGEEGSNNTKNNEHPSGDTAPLRCIAAALVFLKLLGTQFL